MSKPKFSVPLEELREIIPETKGRESYEDDRIKYMFARPALYRMAWANGEEGKEREAKLRKLDEYFNLTEPVELLETPPSRVQRRSMEDNALHEEARKIRRMRGQVDPVEEARRKRAQENFSSSEISKAVTKRKD